MGAVRDLKKLVEAYWGNKITCDDLLAGAKIWTFYDFTVHFLLSVLPTGSCRARHSTRLCSSNDFAMYDHVLDHAFMFGVIPERYNSIPSAVDQYFAMGRGLQRPAEGIDVPAMEMKKWFDTNYHYIVPEFSDETKFSLHTLKPVDEFLEAKALGIVTRPVLLGPVSFLLLGKGDKNAAAGFEKLEAAGAVSVQIDECILVLDQPASLKAVYTKAYTAIRAACPKLNIMVASYFGTIGSNIDFVADLPINTIHVDLVRAPADLDLVLARIAGTTSPSLSVLSMAATSGRTTLPSQL
ncbi:hypothetical protein BSLG_002954 [Batrachochytrium salamandrivorans]|nr:hypothetical protein BSLG_002954 [Batrachochytrium salamandrivorans]